MLFLVSALLTQHLRQKQRQTVVHVVKTLQVQTLLTAFQLLKVHINYSMLVPKNQKMCTSACQCRNCEISVANEEISVLLNINVDDALINLTVNICIPALQ